MGILIALAMAGAAAFQPTTWGGSHVEMEVTDTGARLEFDCARGTIDAPLKPDAAGTFELKGTFAPERSGPSRGEPKPLKATYTGKIVDKTMTLRVVVEGQDERGTTYELVRDRRGDVVKCR